MQHLCICAESHGFYWGFRPQISSDVQIIGENEWATGAVWWAPIPGYTALITWWPLEGFPVTEGWLWSQWLLHLIAVTILAGCFGRDPCGVKWPVPGCNLVTSSYVCHCMPIPQLLTLDSGRYTFPSATRCWAQVRLDPSGTAHLEICRGWCR